MTASPSPKPPTKTPRIEGDHYPTPRWAIDLIVPQLVQRYLTPERQLVIEPACGDGAILEVLAREGVQQILAFELDETRAAAAAAFAGRVPSPLSMVFCADALTESWRRWNVDPTQAARERIEQLVGQLQQIGAAVPPEELRIPRCPGETL